MNYIKNITSAIKTNRILKNQSLIALWTLSLLLTALLLTCCKSGAEVNKSRDAVSSEQAISVIDKTDPVESSETDLQNINLKNHDLISAGTAYYQGDFEKSINLYKTIVKKEPGNRSARLSLIRLLSESGRYNEAYTYALPNSELNSSYLPGSIWEDSSLLLFLSGNYMSYLEEVDLSDHQVMINSKTDQETINIKNNLISEKLFFSALAYKDKGDIEKAIELLEQALNLRGYFPTASLLLGQYYFEKNDFSLSAKNLNTALQLDSNQTAGRVTLAKTILAGGRLSEGHAALKRAVSIRPWDRKTALFLNEFESNNPGLIHTEKAVEEKRRLKVDVPKASVFTPEAEVMPQIRVGLAEDLRELFIKPGGVFIISDSSGKNLFEGTDNQVLEITASDRTVSIRNNIGEELIKVNGRVSIKCISPEETVLLFNVVHSTGYLSAGKEDRAYRGEISLNPDKSRITVINTLPLEEYLYSVVPSEIPSYWPEEALCAQAVAARSYTLANMGRFRKKGYDVSGSIKSHFYRGFTGENEKTTDAVEYTRGMVLKAEGKYLNAFYSANSAGRTESAESVWGGKYPLTGVTDPQLIFETDPPSPDELSRWILSEPESYSSHPKYYYRSSYRWRLIVSADEIEARNSYSLGNIISITTMGRGKSGRVEKVLIKGTKGEAVIKGDKIRKSLGGLRSSLFISMPKLSPDGMPEYFIFAGAGWGHGVGMCQTGAAGMAHEGFTYKEILNHYYPAAELLSIY